MEASAVHAPAAIARIPLGSPLLRLRSDEQLLALFRTGSEDAFRAIHDRYRQRLFAYVRQMLCAGPRQDAEDVLQDVFVRAYGALRIDDREINVRAWLYRVAHNRCIDHLRRPVPPAADLFDLARKPLHDPLEEAMRREDLARLVADIARLPEQQRSALLMREIDGMTYVDLAAALDVTVPAVKSLLVRARIGLVEAAEARDADCADIRVDLLDAYDRGVKASSRARRHMRGCDACTEYRTALRGMRRSFAALSPAGAGPLAMAVAKLLGVGSAGGGAAAGGSAAAGGGAVAAGGVAACKVAAVVCTAALATGGAVEVTHLARTNPPPARAATVKPAPAPAPAPAPTVTAVRQITVTPPVRERVPAKHERAQKVKKKAAKEKPAPVNNTAIETPAPPTTTPSSDELTPTPTDSSPSGGVQAPDPTVTPSNPTPAPTDSGSSGGGSSPPDTGSGTGSTPVPPDPGTDPPPTEH